MRPQRQSMVDVQALEPRYLFAAGDVDTTFQNSGRVDNIVAGDFPILAPTVFLSDGKTLMGGSERYSALDASERYFFRRFNAAGSLDTSFDDGGGLDA